MIRVATKKHEGVRSHKEHKGHRDFELTTGRYDEEYVEIDVSEAVLDAAPRSGGSVTQAAKRTTFVRRFKSFVSLLACLICGLPKQAVRIERVTARGCPRS